MDPDTDELNRLVAAQHEAAHSIARVVLGANLGRTWVDGAGGGMSEGFGETDVFTLACVSMAGPAVENRYNRRPLSELIEDWRLVVENDDVDDDAHLPMTNGIAEPAFSWAVVFVEANWDHIEKVGSVLLDRRSLDADELRAIIR